MNWLTASEVAARLRVSPRHFRESVRWRKGFPPAFQPPRARPLWREDQIASYVQSNLKEAACSQSA